MKEFRYKALTTAGELVAGIRRAEDAATLGQELFAQNLTLVDAKQTLGSLGLAFSFAGRAARRELRDFTMHCSTCLGAGIPMVSALRDFEAEAASGAFKDIITDIREEISSGTQIAEAFAKHPEVFSEVYVALLSAGQDSGNLAEAFTELVHYIEWADDLRARSRQAMVYPAILLTGVLGLFLLLMLYVIPRFMGIFTAQEFQLPRLTMQVMAVGKAFGHWWPFLLGGLGALMLVFSFLRRDRQGRYLLDYALLRLPIVGNFVHKLALSRFARHFSLLFASGIDLLRLLTLLQNVVGNSVLARELAVIHAQVTTGQSLADSFAGSKHFPPLIQRLISVGEKAGNLDVTVVKAADYLDKEIPRALKQAFTLLEAIIIAILGALIAIFALALLLPILQLRNQLV
jgi:type IV pilus assembly protein PilC